MINMIMIKDVCISFHSKSKDSKVELPGDRICRGSTWLNRLPDGAYLCQLTHTPWSCGPQICRLPSGSLWSEDVKGCQMPQESKSCQTDSCSTPQ